MVSGVAQGSILGPHLFISYISSALNTDVTGDTSLIAFADDLLIVKTIRSADDCADLQTDINMVLAEYKRLLLSVNPAKSKYILCTLQTPAAAVQLGMEITIDNEPIERVPYLRYLGVLLDPALSFNRHLAGVSTKAKRAIGALNRSVRTWAGRDLFCKVYLSKILPLLTFASPVVCPTGITAIRQLERIHRFAGRLATNNFTVPYSALLSALNWKSWARICTERQLCTVYKWFMGTRHLPSYILVPRPQPARQLRRAIRNVRQHQLLVNDEFLRRPQLGRIPFRNIATTPLHLAVLAWNILSSQTASLDFQAFKREIQTLSTFAMLVREHGNIYNGRTSPLLSCAFREL